MKIIAEIKTDMKEKFGLPRQSGLVPGLKGRIVFKKEYRDENALRGLDGFSHIWVIWRFDGFDGESWSPTVRPPRLGGNKRIGVFATRSPNRPNPIGLSLLKLDKIEHGELFVSGVDMRDGTAIYDIKPYLKITDCRPDAKDGFAEFTAQNSVKVVFECETDALSGEELETLTQTLEEDPHPSYKSESDCVYGMCFKGYNVNFKTDKETITVLSIKNDEL
jgi:tRNA-Thr(GGU) m(6)t(6)A37 methyltransferase TsaA